MTYLILHHWLYSANCPSPVSLCQLSGSLLSQAAVTCTKLIFCDVHLTVAKAGPCTGRTGRLLGIHTLPDAFVTGSEWAGILLLVTGHVGTAKLL